jgi:hypothetical protein
MFFSTNMTNDGKQCFFSTNDAMILRQRRYFLQFGVNKTTQWVIILIYKLFYTESMLMYIWTS